MSNKESSTDSDSDSSNKVYNINNNTNRNNFVNNSSISDSENNSIITNNIVNSSIGENRVNINNFLNNKCVNIYVTWYWLYNFLLGGRDPDIIDLNYKKVWDVLFKNQIISSDYSKNAILGTISATLFFTEIMSLTNTRQGLLFRKYKHKLTRSVNAENAVRQASRANASEWENHNFLSDSQFKP